MDTISDIEFYKQQYVEILKIMMSVMNDEVLSDDVLKNKIISDADEMITEMATEFNNYVSNNRQRMSGESLIDHLLNEGNREKICRFLSRKFAHEAVKQLMKGN